MMKRYSSILLLLLFTLHVVAQNSVEAKDILDKAYANWVASNGIKLSFSATSKEPDGTEYEPQEGEAYIKGNKFRLEMNTMIIWFDGVTQWVLLKDVNEVNISNPTASDLHSVSPLSLLGIYKEGFTFKPPVAKAINGESVYQVEMLPEPRNRNYKNITVAINKERTTLVQAILIMDNGVQNVINISNYNANYNFLDSEFSFDKAKYPAVEIVDLR